ncbi:alpha-L-iduronidase isoform X2 [Hyla sarda]|uniref:alpha-L-iduronidase isoform X2 n=1 Tax=Hyla sarda TaxID=327740 RepID=UPI0024C33179|nr:alpha-L-iduronidase isoform X2 [Hyla sarda]
MLLNLPVLNDRKCGGKQISLLRRRRISVLVYRSCTKHTKIGLQDMGLLNLLLAMVLMPGILAGSYIINVDPTQSRKEMKHFWKSTGFCPPLPHDKAETYFLGKDQNLNLAYISSVPHSGIVQVRIHWLLDLITALVINGTVYYNFTNLDKFMDILMENELVPGFELMGSPSGYFTSFEDKTQVFEWKQLVFLTAKRYIERYGLEHVSTWNFETWNEPDNHDFDNVSITVTGFQNYYDACSEGLKQASPQLRFGGPGDSCRSPPRSPICWGLLSHCYNGTNIFTGETGVRMDYIALHKKGGGSSFRILEQEIDTVSEIHQRFPQFQSVPIYNDEADPLVGWSTPQSWRGDVTYAAMVIKVIGQHLDFMHSDGNPSMNYSLLSNDNAFMNYYPHYFTQRTLTARFQMNNTKPPHVQMVRKPVLTVMGLLALLGETQISTYLIRDMDISNNSSTVGVIASVHEPKNGDQADSWQSTIVLYASDDNRTSTDIHFITLNLTNFPKSKDLVYVTYYMDNILTNPFFEWQKAGSPDFPSLEEFKHMHNAEDPVMKGPFMFPKDGNLVLKVQLPVPSVLLVHICDQPHSPPGQVSRLNIINLFEGQVALTWSDEYVVTRCLKTYEVEFSPDLKTFIKINTRNIFFTLFTYSPESGQVYGMYRVRAVNYWDVPGLYSTPQQYTEKSV